MHLTWLLNAQGHTLNLRLCARNAHTLTYHERKKRVNIIPPEVLHLPCCRVGAKLCVMRRARKCACCKPSCQSGIPPAWHSSHNSSQNLKLHCQHIIHHSEFVLLLINIYLKKKTMSRSFGQESARFQLKLARCSTDVRRAVFDR